jgi:hypothetical protein
MGSGGRLAGSVVVLGTVFAVAWVAGTATTPDPAPQPIASPVSHTPVASRVALVDGYRVRLDGDLVPGVPSQVFTTITRDGAAVTDLEPHLGGFGHLVALRLEDLTLLQVYPAAQPPAPTDRSGPAVAFTTESPAVGAYRLYLEFRHAGAVHTATFTVPAREVS